CYPRRVNMHDNWDNRWVLFPVDKKGLNPSEITVAEVLKKKGYATACIGKWHLGDQKQFLPTRQGFDQYFGIPYSNDMGIKPNSPKNPPLPLLRDEKVIEAPVDQTTITKRYTEEVIGFIRKNRGKPFFVYLPHTMPHNPVNSSDAFKGRSANSGYGDCVEEIDWSTGEILRTLKELGINRDTLVIFTSDNGAASRWGGSNLPLSGFKGSTMDGGMRVPCVMRWPGTIPNGTSCDELASTIDIMPTFANLAGGDAPKDRIIDGRDIYPLMTGQAGAKSPHEAFYLYFTSQLQAVRSGKWKLHLPTEEVKVGTRIVRKREMKLYDLSADIGERDDLSKKEPKVVKRLMRLADKARAD
ncbi:MAG: sulfatase, partial [Planctomycetes bacterium]|nr:sulfatase [Planctomycetota bacterium]